MLSRIVEASIRFRLAVLALLGLVLTAGVIAAIKLPIDAMPDVSSVQVDIITAAPGLSPQEVENTITFPIENAMNGIPHGQEIRSVSRFGLSAVTVVFADGTDIWFARQTVMERLRTAHSDLPETAGTPELGPPSTGLGTIYRFVVRSDIHSPMQLRTLLDWEIVPKLRSVPGVIEVNTMGGDLKQYQVIVDHSKLNVLNMTLEDVVKALETANRNVGGGYVERSGESLVIRGQGLLHSEEDIAEVPIRTQPDGTAVLVRNVATVKVGAALRHGVVTHNGKTEAVTGIVMMLMGENSRDVVYSVKERMEKIKTELPPGVAIEVIYDRADFVERTVATVARNLIEGVLVVTVVLALFLGTIRGALVVALGIPASMSIALLGMHYFGITGDIMSLGAIDFGFLVDGPVVILEGILAAFVGRPLIGKLRAAEYSGIAKAAARPVAFAVGIITLVYLPLLTLEGVEGKMFRPMALTMACALFGALIYSVVLFPGLMVLCVPPPTKHGPKWVEWLTAQYSKVVDRILALRYWLLGGSVAALVVSALAFAAAGAEFVPRIFEGDIVVAIRRSPSISLDEARKLDFKSEQVLLSYPEVRHALGQTGRAELAIDSVGNDSTDILVALRPMKEWTTADDFDDLSVLMKDQIESQVPGTFVSISQPIEDLTNQLISGSRADVSIKLYGKDLNELVNLSKQIGQKVAAIPGTGDLRVERIMGQPMINATVDRKRLVRYGVTVDAAFDTLAATAEGLRVGQVYEQQRRFDLRVFGPPMEPTAEALGNLFVPTSTGKSVPLKELMTIQENDGPSVIRRQNRERLLRIDVNLRGRDLVSWVAEAKSVLGQGMTLPTGYRLEWGGQFENFERAKKRLAVVVPVVVLIIIGMLFGMFRNIRFALSVFALVPLACIGGMLGLLARGLSFSLPAAIGFIALGGISVLNGVVIANEVKRLAEEGKPLLQALRDGCIHSLRAVLTTGAVAAFGFLPMAISTGSGAEVQRPLATVVIAGIGMSTFLTLAVFPGLLMMALRSWNPRAAEEQEPASGIHPAPEPAE